MVKYLVTVYTANCIGATTLNDVFITLVGTDGKSERKLLKNLKGPSAFVKGATTTFTVSCTTSIGKLVLIEVDKKPLLLFPEDSWYPAKVEVKSPEGDIYCFPIYSWITDSVVHRFREGTALTISKDKFPLGKDCREEELNQRRKDYCWDVYIEGVPHCLKADDSDSLPYEIRYSISKTTELVFTGVKGMAELQLKGLADSKKSWTNFEDINRVFCFKDTAISEYTQQHWKDDDFFGYQCLNGINPVTIQRCTALPKKFPVTDKMVYPHGESSLADEMKKGNIYICDYKHLDGVQPNVINGKKQVLGAPWVLLKRTENDKLIPIAIQVMQEPGEGNLIFTSYDSEYDWLLAKCYVRSADHNEHLLNVHLLRTHMLCEAFAVALVRNFPMVHPLYKLLIPHTRYTMQAGFVTRNNLFSTNGTFTKHVAACGQAMGTVLRNSMSSLKYSHLCIPDDIAERGMESIPNYHYRDDGLRLWDIIHRFVWGIIDYYYKNDSEVQEDSELQKWIHDIFHHGFLGQTSSGIPERFYTKPELAKFCTMVIFTGSAQHAAVNNAQYDYGGWMPNFPSSMKHPPPTEKGKSCEKTLLETLPDVNATVRIMDLMWQVCTKTTDFIPLGQYPEDHFCEEIPLYLMNEFRRELKELHKVIKARNEQLEVPYIYLDPYNVECSVTV